MKGRTPVWISEKTTKHIAEKHRRELAQLGVSAMDYVSMIASRYNMILQGSGNSLLLVVYRGESNDVAAIDLNYSLKNEFWEVKTAEPRRCSTVLKSALIWGRPAKHSANGDGYRLN